MLRMTQGGRKNEKFVPPDGGWGWMVVCGNAVAHVFLVPIKHVFTLLFKDKFHDLGFSTAKVTSLISLNSSFGLILGLLNGPLLKFFGYRKMALVGTTMYVVGLLCTAFADTYVEFIIYYGMLTSLGMSTINSSFSLAMNSYFRKNRSKAVGYQVTLTGLSPIVLPLIISHLITNFGVTYAVLLLTVMSLHIYPATLLLQPIKRHMKLNKEYQAAEEVKIMSHDSNSEASGYDRSLRRRSSEIPLQRIKIDSDDTLENATKSEKEESSTKRLSLTYLDNEDHKTMMNSTLNMIEGNEISGKKAKRASAETLSDLQDENSTEVLNPKPETATKPAPTPDAEKLGLCLRFSNFLKNIYDLDLLQDPSFINIIVGLSLGFSADIIFSSMVPFILKERGFKTDKIAMFMSVIAGCELFFKFTAPFVGRMLKYTSKQMYLIALVMLLLSRSSFFLTSSFTSYIFVSLGLGAAKGFRSVFWRIVLPDYVPISKLASAHAMQSLLNGILILTSGPTIGAITNLTHTYCSVIIAVNILTLTTFSLWTGEMIIRKYRKKSKDSLLS